MSRSTSKIGGSGLFALVFLLIFVASSLAETAASSMQEDPELDRMKAMLDCTCKCGLTLAFCEKEDADCSVRPPLMIKLKKLFAEGKRDIALVHAFVGPMHPIQEQLMEARLQKRHAVLFFYQEGCRACDEVKPVLKEGAEIWGDRVKISHVDFNKKENKKLVQEFKIYSTPTLLVIAPNGVVVREFKENITIEGLESAFVSPAMAQTLRGLQDRRVVFLTVMGEDWKNASSVQKTVSRVGEILRNSVRIVHVDPTNMEEKPFLKMLKVDPDSKKSLTYVVSKSGRVGSRLEGPVSRKDLFIAFQKVLATRSGCGGSGSGPGGNTCQ